MTLFIGLMSGTSMDGIDAALVDVEHHRFIAGITKPYSSMLLSRLKQVSDSDALVSPASLVQLNTLLGQAFADAALGVVEKSGVSIQSVTAIGSHGQTICHDAFAAVPYTLQLACPHTIAVRTGLTVIADFRTRDLVLGGQGAPFAPLYHRELFATLVPATAVVNIGGIANLTLFQENDTVVGFDVGPGNGLMDAWISKHKHVGYDRNGDWAASGVIIPALLNAILTDAYFQKKTPKSIGKEYFSLEWLDHYLKHFPKTKPEDVQATLLLLTATLIVKAIESHACHIERLFVCGGGAHNVALLNQLQALMPNRCVASTAQVGIDPDYIEAMMFAWFAYQTYQQRALDMRAITGASKPTLLGSIYPG